MQYAITGIVDSEALNTTDCWQSGTSIIAPEGYYLIDLVSRTINFLHQLNSSCYRDQAWCSSLRSPINLVGKYETIRTPPYGRKPNF